VWPVPSPGQSSTASRDPAKCKLALAGSLAGSSGEATVNRADLTPFLAGVGIALAVILLAYGAGK
jgi:hypothetical protein